MDRTNTPKSIFLFLILISVLFISSIAFASNLVSAVSIEQRTPEENFEHIGRDRFINEIELRSENTSLTFLRTEENIYIDPKDIVITRDVVAFRSENYRDEKGDFTFSDRKTVDLDQRSRDLNNPELIEKEAIARLTFDIRDENFSLQEGEKTLVTVFRTDDFTSDRESIINSGDFYGLFEVDHNGILDIYVSDLSSYTISTFSTSMPVSIDHNNRQFKGKTNFNIQTSTSFVIGYQYRYGTSGTTWHSAGMSDSWTGNLVGEFESIGWSHQLTRHHTYSYRTTIVIGGNFYVSTIIRTFTLGLDPSTNTANNVQSTSANLRGASGLSMGGLSNIPCYFYYREQGSSDWLSTGATPTTVSSVWTDYSRTVSGLSPSTTYEFQSVCDWNSDVVPACGFTPNCNGIRTFTTSSEQLDPIVFNTLSATSISETAATIRGQVTNLGGYTTYGYYFQYRKGNFGGFTSSSLISGQTDTNIKTLNLGSIIPLEEATLYSYRFVVVSSAGTEYGDTLTFTTSGTPPPPAEGLLDGLVSYYKLDETSGTTASDSHSTNDGTANNARVFTSEVAGQINTGGDFTQGNDYINLNDKFTFIPDTLTFTVSTWVKFEDWNSGSVSNIISNSDFSMDGGLYMRLDQRSSTDRLETSVGRGSTTGNSFQIQLDSFTNNYDLNTWYHIVYTGDGTNGYLYIDGVEVGTSSSVTSMLASPQYNLQIGRNGRNERFLDGYVDEVGIWDRALSESEVEELYNSGNALSYDNFDVELEPPFEQPEIQTLSATTISDKSAIIRGQVIDKNDAETYGYRFQFREGFFGDFNSTDLISGQTDTNIKTYQLGNVIDGFLQSDTTYTYRFVVVTSEGTMYGDTMYFTTLETPPTPPIEFNTATPTNIGDTFATLRGQVIDIGNFTSFGYYFQFREASFGEFESSDIIYSSLLGVKSYAMGTFLSDPLEPEKSYIYRFVVVVDGETYYGDVLTFTTLPEGQQPLTPPPPPAEQEILDIINSQSPLMRALLSIMIIIALFVAGFQLTKTIIGGIIFGFMGFMLGVIIGLIPIWFVVMIILITLIPTIAYFYFRN